VRNSGGTTPTSASEPEGASGPGEDSTDCGARWQSRRQSALAIRALVLLAPVGVSVFAAFGITRLVPAPASDLGRLGWLAVVVVLCGALAFPARSLLRRLLPLAALLELSILFPGEAPSRWKVAREAGSISHLEVLATGVPDTEPGRAATTILALVASLSRHDKVTRGHSERVRVFTDMIAVEMALPRAERDRLRWAALIHDVGKLEIPGVLLRKAGKPSNEEWQTLRLHPAVGARIVAPIAGWLGASATVVSQHHEKFDGTGYPLGLAGEQISVHARIVALADAFEVMTAARPYKKAFSRGAALREVVRCSGTHFDPAAVRALLAVSTPRLRRALGPVSWIGQLPVVGTAPVGGLPMVAGSVARTAGSMALAGVAGAVVVSSVSNGAPVPAPRTTASVTADTAHQAASAPTAATSPAAGPQVDTPAAAVPSGPAASVGLGGSATAPVASVTPSAVPSGPPERPATVPATATSTGAATSGSSAAGESRSGGGSASGSGGGSVTATTPSTKMATTADGPTTGDGSGVAGAVGGVTSAAGSRVTQTTAGLGDTVTQVTATMGGAIGGSLGSTITDAGTAAGSTITDAGAAAGSTVTNAGSAATTTVNSVTQAVGSLVSGTTSAGTTTSSTTTSSTTTSNSTDGTGGKLTNLLNSLGVG
jgi:hypothetical protein